MKELADELLQAEDSRVGIPPLLRDMLIYLLRMHIIFNLK